MARIDPNILAHLEWIGFVKPTGLVVSAAALVRAGAILNRRDPQGQERLRACVDHAARDSDDPVISEFERFAREVLGWGFSPRFYAGTAETPIPAGLEVALPEYEETLRPDLAVREPDPRDGASPWQLLVRLLAPGEDFDKSRRGRGGLEASAHGRLERLLRRTGVTAGLLFNGKALRLVSAPYGESSGWLDLCAGDMVQTAGRPICVAMRLLLGQERLLGLPREKRLAALLEESRKFQNEVSERLAEQVLHALYELLRGFQAAHDASGGALLRRPLEEHPDEVYRAMLSVLLRLIFLLYAEERDMLPGDEVFVRHYSLGGLYERLREDAALYPDTMDQRYGAWAQLLVLFGMIHDGAKAGSMRLPARRGVLFDPDRFPFLEGRSGAAADGRITPPLVPDGTIYRALEKLLVLDGERISYRALDVEQIGSVYETMMGFRLETATGRSVAIKSPKRHGAPSTVDLEALLEEPGPKRKKWLQDRAGRKIPDGAARAVAAATSLEDLHAALQKVVDTGATPDLVPRGAMVLQPSEERRRSGSHYTPRSLTEPIVRVTLEPILERLRREAKAAAPRPEQILDLKVCDPAMGSGAFLVETCRMLGDALVEAWHLHGGMPEIPADEDEVVFARRLIAQRCLYGVDRNPVAVDLAKVSLWLVTLAKDHAFTFLDHALRHGDSVVGLSRRQIEGFHWDATIDFESRFRDRIRGEIAAVAALRRRIREAKDSVSDRELRGLWDQALSKVEKVRILGDLVVAAFFEAEKTKKRELKRREFVAAVVDGREEEFRDWLEELRHAEPPLCPFHWEIELPEVFERERPGFDAIVGNPPFLGGSKISSTLGKSYLDWVLSHHKEAHGNGDIVAHFFRRAFDLVREGGAFGLIATNTIAQGDTRASGLRWICTHGGEIYNVRKRVKWPGSAAVVVSVVHVMKGRFEGKRCLDEREVERITAFLFHRGGHEEPAKLWCNAARSFMGAKIYGQGFTFDDTDKKGVATPTREMERLLAEHPDYEEVIFPYIGGEEVNTHPTHAHHRYVINFGERSEAECRQRWPELMAIVEAKVKPGRMKLADNPDGRRRKTYWWQFGRYTPALHAAIAGLERVLVISEVGNAFGFAFLPNRMVYSHRLIVFPFSCYTVFASLQSRVHEFWVRFFGSSMKDDLCYTPSDCFETYPFPEGWENHAVLEEAGRAYYDLRARLMVENQEGLTRIYNRFHDPDERDPRILELRELHAAMDRAVLEAYGWGDIPTACDFFLDYEDDDENGRSRRKKPWRYRFPDEVQAELLARLLELNAERARDEARSGAAAAAKKRRRAPARRRRTPWPEKDLFS